MSSYNELYFLGYGMAQLECATLEILESIQSDTQQLYGKLIVRLLFLHQIS